MSFFKLTVRDVPLEHKVVLVRADYNVPLTSDGKISDDFRIKSSLPTLHYLLDHGCKVVIMSHLGRPEGRDESLSLKPVAERLEELLGRKVNFVDDCIGDKVAAAVRGTAFTGVLLLENLRFYKEEEANDAGFAEKIAKATGARYFVQDGFGVVHRAHASTAAITQFIPSVAGLLLEREYSVITKAMEDPARPLVAILGGAKVSDKIGVIERFVHVADKILIGGAMANTFLDYKGYAMGASKLELDQKETLDKIYWAAGEKVGGEHIDDFIILPTDVAVAREISPEAKRKNVSVSEVGFDELALDVGDKSIERFAREIDKAKTVVWNGPVGWSALDEFAHGSARIALALAGQKKRTMSIIGGGDTADFVLKWDGGDGKDFGHISTGGGASLELMSGLKLPGVESLLDGRK